MNVDSAMLEQYRQNPAAAVQDGLVVCLECGVLVRRLTRSPRCHARRIHGLDAATYLAKWPGAPLRSGEAKQEELDKHYVYIKANRQAINEQRRARAAKIREIAESDPASPEAARVKKAHDRAADSWREKYHGDGPGDEAAEAFRESESERRAERHEVNKEQENAQQRNRYHGNLAVSRAKSREKAAKLRRLAKLAKAVSKGRPRNDAIRAKVIELRAEGKSWTQVTNQINHETGQTLTTRAYRHYLEDS